MLCGEIFPARGRRSSQNASGLGAASLDLAVRIAADSSALERVVHLRLFTAGGVDIARPIRYASSSLVRCAGGTYPPAVVCLSLSKPTIAPSEMTAITAVKIHADWSSPMAGAANPPASSGSAAPNQGDRSRAVPRTSADSGHRISMTARVRHRGLLFCRKHCRS